MDKNMKCQIITTIRTKQPCTNEATTMNRSKLHVCDECKLESEYLEERIDFLMARENKFQNN